MSPKQRRILVWGGVVGVAIVLAIIIAGGNGQTDLAASGTVEATEARLGYQVPGRVDSIAAREGDLVRAGDVLAWLDRDEMLARREQAAAQVVAADALLRELEAGFRREEVSQGRAARNAARARVLDAERDVARAGRLHEGGAISQEVYDKAALTLEVARDQFEQAEEQLKLLEAGPRPERTEAQRAQLVQARAALKAIDATLASMTVVAPFDGVITVRHHEPGETVGAGVAVLTIMNPNERWVRIYVREDRVAAVKLGTTATITTDTYPDRVYLGEVTFVASQAEFTPKNVQTAEERVKLVYAVKVRITDDDRGDLKPGIPADVRLDVASH